MEILKKKLGAFFKGHFIFTIQRTSWIKPVETEIQYVIW